MYAVNQDLVLAGVWPPWMMREVVFVVVRAHPRYHSTSHVDHEKRITWFSISMLTCSYLKIVRVPCLAALFIVRFILQVVFEIKSPEYFF